jgi:GNAT superfamily N-acetyltransferase
MSESAPPRPSLVFREATASDHPALLALEGSAPHAGAALLQARQDFFARARAYPFSRVLLAQLEDRIVGVICVALNAVRVGGEICQAGYLFNLRVEPGLQRRGIGPLLMQEAWRWAAAGGARYCTGLVRTTNGPSLRMTAALGYAFPAVFEYLILPLAQFGAGPRLAVREVDLPGNPLLAAWRAEKVHPYDFAPAFVDKELFVPPPAGGYAGSLMCSTGEGMAWLSLWDDRGERGLDPERFRAVKAFDLTAEGRRRRECLLAILAAVGRRGIDTLLLPFAQGDPVGAFLAPFAEERLEFQFVLKPLDDAPPPTGRPVYFDVRH